MSDAYAWLDRALATIHRACWYRSPTTIANTHSALVNFGSNNYLGLAGDARLQAAAIAAIQTYGTGSTGSRLLSGHLELHAALERAIANLKGTEDALVFSTGYMANLGTIAAVVGARDLVLQDAYNHACLKQGASLSGAKVLTYPHNDMGALGELLATHRDRHRRCLLATDSVFSMDGDICPLRELVALAASYECMVLVDDAHGTGVFGDRGQGVAGALGIDYPLIHMGTLSKALGSLGGYVAGAAALVEYLRNRASTWIYTTALSPGDAAAAQAAVALVQAEPHHRTALWRNVAQLKAAFARYNLPAIAVESPIVAVKVADSAQALAIAQRLQQKGFYVPAIRPPTVPTARLRLSLMATHTSEQIESVVEAIARLKFLS